MSTAPVAAGALRLAAEGISHRYGPRVALQPVTFDVREAGTLAITGENGSGKSTLLRILIGLLRPSAGRTIFEQGGVAIEARERRRVAGLASPELSFYEEFSAAENLLFAAQTHGLADPRGAVRNALDAVQLTPRGDDRVSDFSSGMKQRLRLAFAVLHRPALLMLDEPGAHLDEAGRDVVARLVDSYARHGLVILATNDPQEMTLAQRRIELRGRGLGSPA